MREIPAELLARINKLNQTKYENAAPKMQMFVSGSRWHELFSVFTIHDAAALGPVDVTAHRSEAAGEPHRVFAVYVENGVAHVKSKPLPYDDMIPWEYEYLIGNASDVAIEFDGYWQQPQGGGRWDFIAEGDPWIAIISAGTLTVQQGQGTPTTMATGVTRCVMLRGWKSDKNPTNDEGLILAYLKTDGRVYYQNRCEQANGTLVWEAEREVTALPIDCVDLSLFRTNDYRTGFIAQRTNNEIHWAVTLRTWAGFGIEETIAVSMQNFDIDLIPIVYNYGYHDEKIAVSMQNFNINYCPFIEIVVLSTANPEMVDTEIIITFDRDVTGEMVGLHGAFTVVDGNNTAYAVTATARHATNAIKLTTASFVSAVGDLTVTYTKQPGTIGAYSGSCWFDVENFTNTFTPVVEPPSAYHSETIAATMQNFGAELIYITKNAGYHEETITTSMQAFTITLIHVDDITV